MCAVYCHFLLPLLYYPSIISIFPLNTDITQVLMYNKIEHLPPFTKNTVPFDILLSLYFSVAVGFDVAIKLPCIHASDRIVLSRVHAHIPIAYNILVLRTLCLLNVRGMRIMAMYFRCFVERCRFSNIMSLKYYLCRCFVEFM